MLRPTAIYAKTTSACTLVVSVRISIFDLQYSVIDAVQPIFDIADDRSDAAIFER